MLVLKEKKNRKGETTSFNVVRAEANLAAALDNIPEGLYKTLDGSEVQTVSVKYRTVQDVTVV